METVVTSAEMQACDRFAIRSLGIPASVLMERAGEGVARAIAARCAPLAGKSVIIFCGKGNNGGDGFVVARILREGGAGVTAALVGGAPKGEAAVNAKIFGRIARSYEGAEFLRIAGKSSLRSLGRYDIIVDALFGTGFSGSVRGLPAAAIAWMNAAPGRKFAVDIPSGVDADDGSVGNEAVRADCTVTMGAKKLGLLTGGGRAHAGEIEVVDIGIPREAIAAHRTHVTEATDVRAWLPKRPYNAHKHSVGKVLVVAGSRGLTGAAAMAAGAAMRSGAGAVVLAAPASSCPILARKLTEVMVHPLPETAEGSAAYGALPALAGFLKWCDVVILGPGLSRNDETRRLIREIVDRTRTPIVLDADGLNAYAGDVRLLRKRPGLILTPHAGELSRLLGIPSADVERGRVAIARETGRKNGITLVLKGAPTAVATADGIVYLNPTGNPGMATAGAGDILAGVIGALRAQGMENAKAAAAGVYIHGLAGDIAAKRFGETSMTAGDIGNSLPGAFAAIA